MIVRCKWKRNEQRGLSANRELGNRGRAGTRNDQISGRVRPRHIVYVGQHVSGDACFAEPGLYLFNVLLACLMQDLYGWGILEALGRLFHGHVDGMSAAAPAEHKDRELPRIKTELFQRLVPVPLVYSFSHERAGADRLFFREKALLVRARKTEYHGVRQPAKHSVRKPGI